MQFLTRASQENESPDWRTIFAPKILAILKGARDSGLADDPALDYEDAAEILFCIERGETQGSGISGDKSKREE